MENEGRRLQEGPAKTEDDRWGGWVLQVERGSLETGSERTERRKGRTGTPPKDRDAAR